MIEFATLIGSLVLLVFIIISNRALERDRDRFCETIRAEYRALRVEMFGGCGTESAPAHGDLSGALLGNEVVPDDRLEVGL